MQVKTEIRAGFGPALGPSGYQPEGLERPRSVRGRRHGGQRRRTGRARSTAPETTLRGSPANVVPGIRRDRR